MENLKKFTYPIIENSIILVCVTKNEYILLEYFIKHYIKIGVTHFVFIDNFSTDESIKYLLNHDANIMVYQTNESFKLYKKQWVETILNLHCKNKWVVLVDTDELIYIDDLNFFKTSMENQKANVCKFYLLDMYSKNIDKHYIAGESFLNHSDCYDKESDINKDYFSGVRKRCMNVPACLQKFSFFKYVFSCCYEVHPGYHALEKIASHNCVRYYSTTQIVLHFKFIKPDLKGFFEKCVIENQYWENSKEYKGYLKCGNYNFFNQNYSVCIRDVKPNFSFL